jgi:hypothetical protein
MLAVASNYSSNHLKYVTSDTTHPSSADETMENGDHYNHVLVHLEMYEQLGLRKLHSNSHGWQGHIYKGINTHQLQIQTCNSIAHKTVVATLVKSPCNSVKIFYCFINISTTY